LQCKQRRHFARLDENGDCEIGAIVEGCPLSRPTLQTRIRLNEIRARHDAKNVVGSPMALLHPFHNVATGGDFPVMNVRGVAERFEFVPDPKRPIAITPRIADENIGHAAVLAVVHPSATIMAE
jgi:hypothetical protein